MAIQSSGPISLSDLTTEFGGSVPHSLSEYYRDAGLVPSNNTNVATSGAINLGSFYNAVNAIQAVATTSFTSAADLFTASEWTSAVPKQIVINAGTTIGPFSIPSNLGGALEVVNAGEIIGLGGAAGAAGGDAIVNNAANVTITNSGLLAGGGGGGGTGGQGGSSSTSSTVREPSSGSYYSNNSSYGWFVGIGCGSGGNVVNWNGSQIGNHGDSNTSANGATWSNGGYTYFKGASYGALFVGCTPYPIPSLAGFGVHRTSTQSSTTTGGAGGAGGVGRGFNQALTAGSAGATSAAGDGGAGGSGGDYGQAGVTGATGANGTTTNGSAGSAGGAAGAAVSGTTVTLTNTGTVNGTVA